MEELYFATRTNVMPSLFYFGLIRLRKYTASQPSCYCRLDLTCSRNPREGYSRSSGQNTQTFDVILLATHVRLLRKPALPDGLSLESRPDADRSIVIFCSERSQQQWLSTMEACSSYISCQLSPISTETTFVLSLRP